MSRSASITSWLTERSLKKAVRVASLWIPLCGCTNHERITHESQVSQIIYIYIYIYNQPVRCQRFRGIRSVRLHRKSQPHACPEISHPHMLQQPLVQASPALPISQSANLRWPATSHCCITHTPQQNSHIKGTTGQSKVPQHHQKQPQRCRVNQCKRPCIIYPLSPSPNETSIVFGASVSLARPRKQTIKNARLARIQRATPRMS